jgi:hypothetical protein
MELKSAGVEVKLKEVAGNDDCDSNIHPCPLVGEEGIKDRTGHVQCKPEVFSPDRG